VTIIKFQQNQSDSPFFEDIVEEGYHVFSLKNAKVPDYYPSEFPDYPGVSRSELRIGDTITIRVFFRIGDGEDIRADGGYIDLEVEHIDLEVEHIDDDKILAVILTELPGEFPLGSGESIDVFEEEILYRNKVTEH
jgi:hypothetical protein